MKDIKKEITYDQYIAVMQENPSGNVWGKSRRMFFTEADEMGCGIYAARVSATNDKYFLEYSIGSSCD